MDITAPHLNDPDAAREYLEVKRWPDGPVCPHCGVIGEAYRLKAKADSKRPVRKGVWKCKPCRKQFTVTVGTIYAESHIPLHKWLMATHLMCASKKGMSAHQLHRMLGITYKSAWFLAHRIRYAMAKEPLVTKLKGTIEADETFVGGKPRKYSGQKAKTGRGTKKIPVLALVERGGRAIAKPIEGFTGDELKGEVRKHVDPSAVINTDDFPSYHGLGSDFEGGHRVVKHSAGEYAVRAHGELISTNEVESFFALLKRGHYGTFHWLSKRHLGRYCAEFSFRWNHRKAADADRVDAAIKGAEGRRLTYREPMNGGSNPHLW